MSSSNKRKRNTRSVKELRESARQKWLSLNAASDLVIVEKLLRESIDAVDTSNEEDRNEQTLSLDALCLLLCQQSRDKEAVVLMQQMGHVARLSKEVLHYAAANTKNTKSFDPMSTPLRVFDDSLAPETLKRLQATFCAADADYWTSHNYSVYPPSAYFSFVVPLIPASFTELGPLGDLLRLIVNKTEEHFGGVEDAKYAELWAHRRPHASGHQLHFDSDNEGRGGVRNPLVSTVLYLSDEGCGGPTLVTDQHIDGESLAQTGWVAFPKKNRLVIFDGAVLHGVIPGRGYVNHEKSRTTLMVALWDDIRVRNHQHGPGAAMPLPLAAPKTLSKELTTTAVEVKVDSSSSSTTPWQMSLTSPLELRSEPGGASVSVRASIDDTKKSSCILINPMQVDRVWTDLEDHSIGNAKPHYDTVFQGF